MRSEPTILVEGKDDKDVFNRLKLTIGSNDNVNIDTADILNDPSLAGLGSKARIDAFATGIPAGSPIITKLRCVVDREWEGLIDQTTSDPLPWTRPTAAGIRIETAGHSIENYGFSPSFVISYLEHFGQGVATAATIAAITAAFPALISAGAAFSEIARKRQVIVKCSDIIGLDDISWNGNQVTFLPSIEQKLAQRGCSNGAGFLQEIETSLASKWTAVPLSTEARYHVHGHIGESVLWVGVARVAMAQGVSEAVAKEIALGRRDERRRVWHSWLCKLPTSEIAPLQLAFH